MLGVCIDAKRPLAHRTHKTDKQDQSGATGDTYLKNIGGEGTNGINKVSLNWIVTTTRVSGNQT